MYKNLYAVAFGCLLLIGVFFLFFSRSARGRADFVWNNGTEPQTLDPGLMSGQPEGEIAVELYEGLTSYHPESLDPIPGVAESWEVDGLRYVFHLRPDSWFVHREDIYQVDGRPRAVTAHDFVYAWNRHLLPETGSEYSYLFHLIAGAQEYETKVAQQWKEVVEKYAKERPGVNVLRPSSLDPEDQRAVENFRKSEWENLVGIKALDDRTLEVTLNTPAPYFLALTSFYPFYPVLEDVVVQHGDRWVLPENIVTNGPYYLDDWQFNSFVRLRKNPNFWSTEAYKERRLGELAASKDLAKYERQEMELLEKYGSFEANGLQTLDALAIEERNTSLNLYINGDIDRDREIPAEVVGDLLREAQRDGSDFKQIHHGTLQTVYFFELNMKRPVFQGENGRKLRRALALAVDRQGVVDVVTRAFQRPAYRLVPPGVSGYDNSPLFGSGDYEKDVAEAKRLVAEVRAAGVRIPTLQILYNTHQGHEKIAAFLQNNWKTHLGIDAKPANQEWGVFLDSRRTGSFDVARSAWIADYPDPNTFLDMFTTGNQNNDPKYENPIYDRLVMKYCARILDYLATDESRRAVLEDLKNSDYWKSAIEGRRRADGRLLGEALTAALTSEPPQGENAKLEHAAMIRLLLFEAAEEILIYDMPIISLYFYTTTQIWPPELEGMFLTPRDVHPLRYLRWQGGTRPTGSRYQYFPRIPNELPKTPAEANAE